MFDRKFLKHSPPRRVEGGVVFFKAWRAAFEAAMRVAIPAVALVSLMPPCARADTPPPAPGAAAPAAAKPDLDELVYNDGDRIRGHFVEQKDTTIVFKSERFGELRVAEADAKVVLAVPAAPGLPSNAPAVSSGAMEGAAMAAADADRLWVLSYLSPVELKRRLQQLFGSWHGKFQFSTELVSDTTSRNTITTEAHLQRKWTSDEVQINARYDFSETDDVTTTDIIKSDASWRHDFPDKLFSIYRPSIEWNRAYETDAGIPSDYVLLQQEIGAGVNVFALPARQLRTGVSENIFDVWASQDPSARSFRAVESVFLETEWGLPWRISVKDRGVIYYSVSVGAMQGWENRFEVDKKLTETLSIGVRHELRHSEEDLSVQDYKLLKLLVGLDF
jgi:hypothetical protein